MILFMIGCFSNINTGRGGHYYSLMHIFNEIPLTSQILVVGDFLPPIYKNKDCIYFTKWSNLITSKKIEKILEDADINNVSVIHCYDVASYLFGSLIARKLSIPIVLTKPGGPKPSIWYPRVKNQIVFHQEDVEHIKRRKFLQTDILRIISNRVSFNPQQVSSANTRLLYNRHDSFKVMRIGRIGENYKSTILQAIELCKKLKSISWNCELCIIGHIESSDVHASILTKVKSEDLSNDVSIYSSDFFTNNSVRFINQADAIVGTGRSFMEGLALPALMFFPVKDSNLPCFCYSENYTAAFDKNFSQRITKNEVINPEESFEVFIDLIDKEEKNNLLEFYKSKFESDHSISKGVTKLISFYPNCKKDHFFRFIFNTSIISFALTLKKFIHYIKRYLK